VIIKLAGYNIEVEQIDNLESTNGEILTPETFSSAYARISRSQKDVTTLRYRARQDIEKARKSNKTIIFDMGHHSVAEHAVFNFDIIGVSRLALEEIEQFRLVSFTEKSQRYVTLKGDFVLPKEIKDKESQKLFIEIIQLQNEFYTKSFSILREYIFNKFPKLAEKKSNVKLLEGWAKEDARYILALATEGQVGMTINARNLEHLLRRFSLSKRTEVKDIGKEIFEQVKRIAPSIILFLEPSNFAKDFETFFKRKLLIKSSSKINKNPKIIDYTKNADEIILASFFSIHNSINFNEALKILKALPAKKKENLYKDLFKRMEFFDNPPREFEMADITFEVVISASNFAQLKRHRMATLLSGDYHLEFGNIIPENIKACNLQDDFLEIINRTNDVYKRLIGRYPHTADYILTNSHCRQVIMKMNLRELYHFIRLRDDDHAQWEIRELAHHLLEKVKPLWPQSTLLLCGKSNFVKKFKGIYNKSPEYEI
jgi:flavin-dependent thymidylate synthase